MRLGARWRVGEAPHVSVPAALHPAILEQEAEHRSASSWTLTWLEGRPRCELIDDSDGHVVTVTPNAAGEIRVLPRVVADGNWDDERVEGAPLEDDDWLT